MLIKLKYLLILFTSLIVYCLEGYAAIPESDNWGYPDYIFFTSNSNPNRVYDIKKAKLIPVIYKVNRIELQESAMLDSIVSTIQRVRQDRYTTLQHIWIGGSASPEGPLDNNIYLGENRALALKNYLLSHTNIPDSLISIYNLEEDWYNTEAYLRSHEFENGAQILRIIAEEPNRNLRKKAIQAIDDGETWQRLVDIVFPPLRNARLIIECSPRTDTISSIPVGDLALDLKASATNHPVRFEFRDIEQIIKRRQFVALKTNLLFAALLTANLSVEAQLTKHFSIDVPIYYSPYDITDKLRFRLLATQPEVRYWPREAGEGWFCGLHATVAGFNVSTPSSSRYQDPNRAMWGVGIGGGWAHNFGANKEWTIECNLGVGYLNAHWDAYRNWHNGPKYDTGSFRYWGITRAGVSIGYKWYYVTKSKF